MESSREVTAAPAIGLRSGWLSSRGRGWAASWRLGLGLRLWRLDRNGYGTEYYSAGVRSMLQSPHTFLYNSFDPAGLRGEHNAVMAGLWHARGDYAVVMDDDFQNPP